MFPDSATSDLPPPHSIPVALPPSGEGAGHSMQKEVPMITMAKPAGSGKKSAASLSAKAAPSPDENKAPPWAAPPPRPHPEERHSASPEELEAASQGSRPSRPGPCVIRDALIPAMMQLASGSHHQIGGAEFKSYRDVLVREAGSQDVLEQTLLEQVALAHLSASQLLANAGLEKTSKAAGIYATAAAKLMGEVRRTVVAIKELRSPTPPASITIAATQQVNLTTKAETEVAAAEEKMGSQSKLGSNNASGPNRIREILAADAGRAQEPAVAGTTH
jgi:hypothetical protein